MAAPKEQKVEYWRVSEYSSRDQEGLEKFINRHSKEGWFAHQIVPVNGSTHLSAAYIVFYKF